MININNYINEKLIIDKNIKIDNNEKEINFIIKNLKSIIEKYYTDNNFEIEYLKDQFFNDNKYGIKVQFKVRILIDKLNKIANDAISELKKLNKNLKYYQVYIEYYNVSAMKKYIIIFIKDIEK